MTEKQEQQFQKLIGFVKQLAEQHNALEVRVEALERNIVLKDQLLRVAVGEK